MAQIGEKMVILTENLSFNYNSDQGGNTTLKSIDFSVKKGEFVAVLGHNGSGKSTLAKHLNAILLPSGGKVYVNGIDTSDSDRLWDIRSNTAMVFQSPDNQIVATVVEEDVAFGVENLGIPSCEIKKRVTEALEIVGMSEFAKHAPHLLSGGQKQRVAIAGVIAMRPEIIVFDEATAMLDPKGRKEVMDCILKLNKTRGITVVFITHNMDEAVLADRVVVINEGEILMNDVPKKVFSNVEILKSYGLDVPQVTYLTHLLRKRGIDIPEDILTVDEFVMEIKKLCQ